MSPRVLFEPDTGRLRMEHAAFDALRDWAHEDDVDPYAFGALRESGVVEGNQPHPMVAPAFAAIADPACVVLLQVNATDGSGFHGLGWMGEDTAAMLLDTEDDLVELVTVAPQFVLAALCRVLDISPRPLPKGEPVRTSQAVLETFFSIDHPDPGSEPIPEIFTVDGTRRWAVTVATPTDEKTLRVVDTPDGYWYVSQDQPDGTTLEPATATTVVRHLLRLFPSGPLRNS